MIARRFLERFTPMCRTLLTLALIFCTATGAVGAEDGDPELGKVVYDMHCSGCHGPGLRSPGTSFDLRELTAEERARFDTAVLDGKGMMPAWRGTVTEPDLTHLWAYIREYAHQ